MLYITEQVKIQIIEAGLLHFPEASFGILLGFEKRDIRIIEKVIINNHDAAAPLTAQDHLQAALQGAEQGLSVLGIFCTLPNKPSTTDSIDYSGLPDYYSVLLLSIWGGDYINLQSWRMNQQNKITEEQITVVHDQHYEPLIRNENARFSIHYN